MAAFTQPAPPQTPSVLSTSPKTPSPILRKPSVSLANLGEFRLTATSRFGQAKVYRQVPILYDLGQSLDADGQDFVCRFGQGGHNQACLIFIARILKR